MARPTPLTLLNAVFCDPAWLSLPRSPQDKGWLVTQCVLLAAGLSVLFGLGLQLFAPRSVALGTVRLGQVARYALVCASMVGLPVRSQVVLHKRAKQDRSALIGALAWLCFLAAEILYEPATALFFSVALLISLHQLSRYAQVPFSEGRALPAGLLVGASVALWGPHPLYIGIAVALGFVIGEGPTLWSHTLVSAHGAAVIALWALLLTMSYAVGLAAGLWFDSILVWCLAFCFILAVREAAYQPVDRMVQRILRRYLRFSPRSIWEDWGSGLTLWALLATTYGALVSLPAMALAQTGLLAEAPWAHLPIPHALLLAGLMVAGLTRLPIWPLELLWALIVQNRLARALRGQQPDFPGSGPTLNRRKQVRRLLRRAHWDRACILPQLGYRQALRFVEQDDHGLAVEIACREISVSHQFCQLTESVQALAAADPLGIQAGLAHYQGHVNKQRTFHFAATSLPPGPSAAWKAALGLFGLSFSGKQHQLAQVLETLDESIRLLEQSQRLTPNLPMVEPVLALYRSLSEALAVRNYQEIAAWTPPVLQKDGRFPLGEPVPKTLAELGAIAGLIARAEGLAAAPEPADGEQDVEPVPATAASPEIAAPTKTEETPTLPEALSQARQRLKGMAPVLRVLSPGLDQLFYHILRHWVRLIRAGQGDRGKVEEEAAASAAAGGEE